MATIDIDDSGDAGITLIFGPVRDRLPRSKGVTVGRHVRQGNMIGKETGLARKQGWQGNQGCYFPVDVQPQSVSGLTGIMENHGFCDSRFDQLPPGASH